MNFPEKHIPIGLHKHEQEVQKTKMRKHNHDFTETHKKQFASEYHANYNKAQDPSSLRQALSAKELQQKVVDLRKSHVVLGEDFNAMRSIAQTDYQSKKGGLVKPANDNVAIRRTNFQLGNAGGDMASMYQQSFVPHTAQRSESDGALMKDLRGNYFDKYIVSYNSNSQSLYSWTRSSYLCKHDGSFIQRSTSRLQTASDLEPQSSKESLPNWTAG